MSRHEQDEWDIASGVGVTALAAAAGRAIESKRADALITDPYAEALVAAAGSDVPMPTTLPQPGYEHDQQVEDLWSQMATHMGLRTRFFDEFFTTGWGERVKQVVLLASGLDARAWRLAWPAGPAVFEIDQPRVLTFKDMVLARQRAEPRCWRRAVAVDLRQDWPTALEQAGFDRSQPTAWLVEGLLPYLPDDAEERLLAAAHELSAPGSRIAVEHMRSLQMLLQDDDGRFAGVADQLGINITELIYDNQARPDPDERLAERGWQTTVATGAKLAATYGRLLDGLPSRIAEQQRYITAHLPK